MPLPDYAYPPLVPTDPDRIAADIARVLQESWERAEEKRLAVLAEIDRYGRKGPTLARLREYQDAITQFQESIETESARFVSLITGQYAAGLEAAAVATTSAVTWTLAHKSVVASLASDSYADLLARSVAAGRTSESFARAVRRVAREEMPLQATGGKTARQVGRDIRLRLEAEHRIGAVVYRDGSVHTAKHYTEMLSRTKGRVAYNAGTLNGYHQAGVEYVEVFDGADCGWVFHRDFDKANGTIRSVESAASVPISHPNCRRSFGARPDVRGAKQAREATPLQDMKPYRDLAHDEALQTGSPAVSAGQSRRDALAARRSARAGG